MKFVYDDGGRSKYYAATNVGDCATRAIAIATGADYKLVYKALSKIAGKPVRNGCPKNADKKLLEILGWKWTATMAIGAGCKVHLCEDELPDGILVVQVSGHLVAVKYGVVHDTYDCTRRETRCVYGYWQREYWISPSEHNETLLKFLERKKPAKREKKPSANKVTPKKKTRVSKPKNKVSEATRIRRLEKRIEKLEKIIESLTK